MLADTVEILARAVVSVAAILILTRLNGLRTFSKMSSFEFAITVAYGSVIAGTVMAPGTSLVHGLAALGALVVVQGAISRARAASDTVAGTVGNTPIIVMRNGKVLSDNLASAGMTVSDLHAKLRASNAYDLDRVHAVVFESTGDVSVLHGPEAHPDAVSAEILQGIRGA